MQITAEINLDDVAAEVEQALMDSSSFDRHINDLVENLVTDQIAEAIERIDIDDIADFERRSEEIAQAVADDAVDEIKNVAMLDAEATGNQDDRVTNLEQAVENLQAQVDSLTEALGAVAILLKGVVAG